MAEKSKDRLLELLIKALPGEVTKWDTIKHVGQIEFNYHYERYVVDLNLSVHKVDENLRENNQQTTLMQRCLHLANLAGVLPDEER